MGSWNHGDFPAAQGANLRRRGAEQIFAQRKGGLALPRAEMQQGLALGAGAGRRQAHQSERQHGLARAGLTDNADCLAFGEREGHLAHRAHPSAAGGQLDGEVGYGKPYGHLRIISVRVTRGEVLRYRWPMSKPACPLCQTPAVDAGKLRYCAACGWQKNQTEKQLRLKLKMVPIAFAVMTLILVLLFVRGGARTQNAGLIAFFLSFPLIALLVSYAITRRNLKVLLAQPPPTARSAGEVAIGAQPPAPNPRYQALLKTVAPRELRMSRRGKFNLTLTLVVLLIFAGIMVVELFRAWAAQHSFAAFGAREWGMAGFAVLLLLMLVWQWRTVDKERELMTYGEVAAAKVVEKFGSRNASAIRYEFDDFTGQKHVKIGTDYTQRLEEGMTVPVFYERDNPDRQVPACGTFHEVVPPADFPPG